MKYTTLTATMAALTISAIAHGQEETYASGQFGLRAVEQTDSSAGAVAIESELGNAGYYAFAIGRRYDGMRFELELARRGGEINSFAVAGTEQAVTGDGLTATSLMANAYVDFNADGTVSPYIGGGLGMAKVAADYVGAGGSVSGDASALSFQLIGGASIQVSERIELFSDLRYMRVMETDHALTAPLGSSDVSFQYDGYTLGAGVRVSF